MPENEKPDDDLARLMGPLIDHIKKAMTEEELAIAARRRMDKQNEEVMGLAETFGEGGIMVPVGVNREGVHPMYWPLLDDILTEQSKASVFLTMLDREHGYVQLMKTLATTWSHSAALGAMEIAKRMAASHECNDPECEAGDGSVGPSEFNAAWVAISMSAVLGAVRYGQANPEAFKGLEGVEEGDIDKAVVDLLAFVEAEAAKGNEEE